MQLEARDVPAIVQTPIIKWEPVGPDPTINAQVSNIDTKSTVPNPAVGAIEEIALHPTDANIAFVASANGGVWRTTNATAARPAYTPLTDSAPALSVASMSLNSENPNQLIAGIGHQSAYAGVGGDFIGALYTDNALDPTPAFRVLGGALQNRDILAVVARNGYLLAAGTRSVASAVGTPDVGGVFRSLDDGATFTNLLGTGGLPDDVGKVFFLQPDPGNSNRVYVATATGLYKTENIRAAVPVFANITVALQKFGPVVATTVNAKLAVHNSAAGNVVYLSVTDDYALASVSYSTDFGATWTAMDLPSELGAGRKVIDATLASPIAIKTAVAHGFQTGDRVNVSGVKGNLGANGVWSVTVTAPDGFTLDQSAGTGIYTGGGQVASAQGVNPGGQGEYHSSLAADPIDPNVLYIAGDRTTVYRGNRSVPAGNNDFLPSPQYTRLGAQSFGDGVEVDVSNKSGPYSDSRVMAVAPDGTLWEGDDGGVYRRPTPRTDGVSWTSAIGNLSVAQFVSLNYDKRSGSLFGGTQDTGSISQTTLNKTAGVWQNLLLGDGGTSGIDSTSNPDVSYRYVFQNVTAGARRVSYDASGAEVGRAPIQFAAPGKTARLSGLDPADAGFTVFTAKVALNVVDPRLLLFSNVSLYEDNDPAGLAGDTVAKSPLDGQSGIITALQYGGRQNGVGYTRLAYVGTESGQVYARGISGGFTLRPLPAAASGGVTSITVDPDDWRRVTVLVSTDVNPSGGGPYLTNVYTSTDAGQSWKDISAGLIAPLGTTTGVPTLAADGTLVGGLSSEIISLATVDPAPNGTTGGNTLLFAAGRGGVYEYTPPAGATGTGTWAKFGYGLPNGLAWSLSVSGTRLSVGTQGRGSFTFADVTGNTTTAVTVVTGDAAANTMTVGPDPADPTKLVVTDGLGTVARVSRGEPNRISFVVRSRRIAPWTRPGRPSVRMPPLRMPSSMYQNSSAFFDDCGSICVVPKISSGTKIATPVAIHAARIGPPLI